MALIYITFDFGNDEDKAQQARHKIDSLKQSFRLDKKLLYKVDRSEAASTSGGAESSAKEKSAKNKTEKKAIAEAANGSIKLLLRLAMPPHEKLTQQRLLERIPSETPLDSASPKVLREGDPDFAAVEEQFENLG
jgi:hypothetical protein